MAPFQNDYFGLDAPCGLLSGRVEAVDELGASATVVSGLNVWFHRGLEGPACLADPMFCRYLEHESSTNQSHDNNSIIITILFLKARFKSKLQNHLTV